MGVFEESATRRHDLGHRERSHAPCNGRFSSDANSHKMLLPLSLGARDFAICQWISFNIRHCPVLAGGFSCGILLGPVTLSSLGARTLQGPSRSTLLWLCF